MESSILDFMSFLETINFGLIVKFLAIGFLAFWIVVIGWVIYDSSQRYKKFWMVVLSALLVLVLNFFGLVIYLIVRPKQTHEEMYWGDLEKRYLRFETAGLEDCPNCHYPVQPNFINCPMCGKELRVKCQSCGVYLEPEWAVCPFCAQKQKNTIAPQTSKSMEKRTPDFFEKKNSGVKEMADGSVVTTENGNGNGNEESQAFAPAEEIVPELSTLSNGQDITEVGQVTEMNDEATELAAEPVITEIEDKPESERKQRRVISGMGTFFNTVGSIPGKMAIKLFTRPKKVKDAVQTEEQEVADVEVNQPAITENQTKQKKGKKNKKNKKNRH